MTRDKIIGILAGLAILVGMLTLWILRNRKRTAEQSSSRPSLPFVRRAALTHFVGVEKANDVEFSQVCPNGSYITTFQVTGENKVNIVGVKCSDGSVYDPLISYPGRLFESIESSNGFDGLEIHHGPDGVHGIGFLADGQTKKFIGRKGDKFETIPCNYNAAVGKTVGLFSAVQTGDNNISRIRLLCGRPEIV